nr:unnamed protein product [Digitaria exilis]
MVPNYRPSESKDEFNNTGPSLAFFAYRLRLGIWLSARDPTLPAPVHALPRPRPRCPAVAFPVFRLLPTQSHGLGLTRRLPTAARSGAGCLPVAAKPLPVLSSQKRSRADGVDAIGSGGVDAITSGGVNVFMTGGVDAWR